MLSRFWFLYEHPLNLNRSQTRGRQRLLAYYATPELLVSLFGTSIELQQWSAIIMYFLWVNANFPNSLPLLTPSVSSRPYRWRVRQPPQTDHTSDKWCLKRRKALGLPGPSRRLATMLLIRHIYIGATETVIGHHDVWRNV